MKTKEIPIPFSGPMVRAIHHGQKTETRRLIRWPKAFGGLPPRADALDNLGDGATLVATDGDGKQHYVECPYGGEGDVLWVREAFMFPQLWDRFTPAGVIAEFGVDCARSSIHYLADQGLGLLGRYRNARFLPRVLSRTDLTVREFPDAERLSAITDEAALREGIVRVDRAPRGVEAYGLPEWHVGVCATTPREAYIKLFRAINGDLMTESDPWVWVTKFDRRLSA